MAMFTASRYRWRPKGANGGPMVSDALDKLGRAPYVSLATFRRSGAEVATPVWCAPAADDLYVFSAGDAGKVKRLKNSDRARLAVCDVRGRVLGPWQEASAELVDDPGEVRKALVALRSKYGWQMRLADLGARLTGRFQRRSYIRIRLTN
jgi:PPOX class probable F420-dependent enzyme